MTIDDNTIVTIDAKGLLSQEFMYSMLEIEEKEEKARLEGMAKIRAKELGIRQDFISALKAYNEADKKLSQEYTKAASEAKNGYDLEYGGNGFPLPSIDNFLIVLENDEKFKGLKFNLLTYSPEQERDGVTYKWLDADDAEARRYIEKKHNMHNVQKFDDALRIVFAEHQYHPIRDLIDGFEWDGKERISDFLHYVTRCEDTEYTREVSRLIFAGGINRLYHAGCKFDDMPVLIGTKQGEGKSTLVRWLALKDEYFTEVTEFDGQRGIEQIEGAWICEVGELLAMTRQKEQEAVKSYLTRMNDRYRMPFDKRVTDHQRQCIFIGTTNKEQFLTDKTGNRRFYPVKINQSGYELFDRETEIKAYIKQCWAEAKAKLDTEFMSPYADRSLIKTIREKQADATEDDYRIGLIEEYLEDKDKVCILELWREALGMSEYSEPSRKDSCEISLILQSLGEWERNPKSQRTNYGIQKCWEKIKPVEVEEENPVEIKETIPF